MDVFPITNSFLKVLQNVWKLFCSINYQRILKLKFFRKVTVSPSSRTKTILGILLVLWYGWLLWGSLEWSDHVEIACIHVLTFVPTLHFLLSVYIKFFLWKFLQLLSAYGLLRIFLYLLVLTFISYCLGYLMNYLALQFMIILKHFFTSRFESNFLDFHEHRSSFERQMHYILSDEQQSQILLQLFMRYPNEDVQMSCKVLVVGFSGCKPFTNQVEWRRNRVPLKTVTDRYSQVVYFTELSKQEAEQYNFKEKGLALYELNSTLTIYLLQESDFGSYTCHIPDDYWTLKTGQKKGKYFKPSTGCKIKPQEMCPPEHSSKPQFQPERKYVFQDTYIHVQHLIMMAERKDQVVAGPYSILFFTTVYWHLSDDADLEIDYTVNDVSFQDLCDDIPFQGCSPLQALTLLLGYDPENIWSIFCKLPILLRGATVRESFTAGHCLCENSFGIHKVRYLRRYYNRTSKQQQLIEITHPQTLQVRPPKQNASHFFSNFFNYDPIQLLPQNDYLPNYAFKFSLIKDLAIASVMLLTLTDTVIIMCILVFIVTSLIFTVHFLRSLIHHARCLCLEGSMGYLYTAKRKIRLMLQEEKKRDKYENFDFYLAHSDLVVDQRIVSECIVPLLEGQLEAKVFLRERDLPPNELEIASLSKAIWKSNRFIIFLSEDYIHCKVREIERALMWEFLLEHHSKVDGDKVLVIRLDHCDITQDLVSFRVHNWTSGNLQLEDHILQLMKWINQGQK